VYQSRELELHGKLPSPYPLTADQIMADSNIAHENFSFVREKWQTC
jgi:hypothetical protein